jgi:malate dehydrogenase (oxaloacetate-decarboxylating)(NADP+)
MPATQMLKLCPLLSSLSADEVAQLAALGTEVCFEPGFELIAESSAGTALFFLLEGSVEVVVGGRVIDTEGPGSVLGEMCLFNQSIRTATVRAASAGRALRLEVSAFHAALLADEPAAVKTMSALGELMMTRLLHYEERLLAEARRGEREPDPAEEAFAELKRGMLFDWALKYHQLGSPGKLTVTPSKPIDSPSSLAAAYTPGVARPCLAIRDDPANSYVYTSRSHLVAVITNGTAVLGLGDIGPLAAKPVMEGKAVLFKRFGGVDAIDIEVEERDPAAFVDVVCKIGRSFGGINLEDVKAPECFFIEKECQRRLDIPVMHDDQHGTAIVAGAGLLNALELTGRAIEDVKVVFSGAGAAGFACALYFLSLGVRRENLVVADRDGVVHAGRPDLGHLAAVATATTARTLADVIEGADVFVGLSVAGALTPDLLSRMAPRPIVFALANPAPEIDYPTAVRTRPDVVMATGRSDYPNQINNVSSFPYLFRGALDCRATGITEPIKQAATRAIAALAREGDGERRFGREFLVPSALDPRLLERVAPAVVEAAEATGVARLEVDLEQYRRKLRASRGRG